MFSVNIDKLISMTPKEETAYQELCNHVLAKGRKYKTIAVTGENGVAFKLAEVISRAGNNVLFIDADLSSPIFINKYKLGKNLKGICDYLAGNERPDNLICVTNKENLNIVFTGDVNTNFIFNTNDPAFYNLMELYKKDYDYIILEVGNNSNMARKCDGSLLVMDNENYSQKKAKKAVDELTEEGCLVLGVVLSNM